MFSFAKDALDVIGQGTVKKSKMANETTDKVAPQSSFDDAKKILDEAAMAADAPYKVGASAEDVNPANEDDIYIVPNALSIPLAVRYAAKDNSRVLVVESSEARVNAAVKALAEQNKDISVAKGLPFEFAGPKKVTVTSSIVLAGVLSKRKNLGPFTHIIISNVTSFTIGVQVLLNQLRRIINHSGAKGHHRVLLCGDVQIALEVIKPIFNQLKVSGMKTDAADAITIDTVAAYNKDQLVKIPAASTKTPFVPFTSFAADQAKQLLAWAKANLKTEGPITIFAQEGVDLSGAAVPVVDAHAAASTKGLFAVVSSTAESLSAEGIRPVAVIDLGVSTTRGSNSPAEALIQDPRTEFASTVEIAQRRALAGNHPYFALYAAAAPRPLRSFDAILSLADRNELLQATRSGLDFRAFIAPIRETALEEALTAFAELGLIQSKAEPVQTFLGEIVSRLSCVTAEMGTFITIATALGLADVATAVAAVHSVGGLYKDVAQQARLRGRFDPDDSTSSDLLADAVVLLTESEHADLDAGKLAAAHELQSTIHRTLANYQPPTEKRTVTEQRATLTKYASLLAFLLSAAFATNACKINASQGDLLNIRTVERVKGPAAGSAVSFPTSGAIVTAATLRKDNSTDITYDGVTILCTSHFNAAQIILRPVVQHSSAADTNSEGDSIIRFAVASNGYTHNYHVPVDAANRVIEARAALCTALGLLMLRRLTTPHATSAEDFVAAIRRKRRDFSFVKHMEETARKLEAAVQESTVTYVLATFVKKQTSVLAPSEAGLIEADSPAAVATDVLSIAGMFDKTPKKDQTASAKKEEAASPADEAEAKVDAEPAAAAPAERKEPAADEAAVSAVYDEDAEDYFAKNGPIMDDDDDE